MTQLPKWQILNFDETAIQAMQRTHALSPYLSKILLEKNITTDDAVRNFLSPGVHSLHAPVLLPDIEKGCDRIEQAIKRGEKILVWGDEDTDGVTATVVLYELLRTLNAQVYYHIPSRRNEGIGLNEDALQHAADSGISLIVTVDCASSDGALILWAQSKGMDVVVTDHHETEKAEHDRHPLINPKRKDSTYPFRDIAGVTVAFKLGWYLAQSMLSLTDEEWQSAAAEWFPLVFLGTYGDRVPLLDENWMLARLGFFGLAKTERRGLSMLSEMLCKEESCDELSIQKMIGVFSAGKTELWGKNTAFKILTEEDESFLRKTISELIAKSDTWHTRANENYRKMLMGINDEPGNDIIALYSPDVAFEYLGFCASRLKERYGKPVVTMSDKDDIIVGEARSPREIDIHAVLAKTDHLFSSFGGHKPACGFTLEKKSLYELKTFLSEDFPEITSRKPAPLTLRIIDELPLSELSQPLKRELLSLAPFGVANPPPLFLAKKVSLSKGIYSYTVPETGEAKRIEIKSDAQSWNGIDGKSIQLDVVYYFNSGGALTIADARPSLFNETNEWSL